LEEKIERTIKKEKSIKDQRLNVVKKYMVQDR